MKTYPTTALRTLVVGLVTALAAAMGEAHAAPAFFSYQGLVTDAGGTPIGSGTPVNRTVTFRFYDTPTAGSPLYSEKQVVTIADGEFSVLVGQGLPVPAAGGGNEPMPPLDTIFTSDQRFLGVTVDDGTAAADPEISPRQQLASTVYAIQARNANDLVSPAGTTLLSSAGGQLVATSSLTVSGPGTVITGNGAGLTSLNSAQLTGAIPDARLSLNVARRDAANTFAVGNQSVTGGNLGIGTSTPNFPLSLASTTGDKISLWGDSGNTFGFGVGANQLQIHTNASAADIVFGHGSSANLVETARISGGGSLTTVGGIVSGTTVAAPNGFSFGAAAAGGQLYHNGSLVLNSESGSSLQYVPSGGGFFFHTAGIQRVAIDAGGIKLLPNTHIDLAFGENRAPNNGVIGYKKFSDGLDIVGAGTATDGSDRKVKVWAKTEFTGPITVSGTGTTQYTGSIRFYYNPSGDDAPEFPNEFVNNSIAIDARAGSVVASDFWSTSDERIKDGIRSSDCARDLELIRGLRVADYRLLDRVLDGGKQHKGFIAQEVEKVIPEAVSKGADFVPDVMALPEAKTYDAGAELLTLTLSIPHGLSPDDTVRIFIDDAVRELTVASVASPKTFSVTGIDESPKDVFVYGKQVDDFRTVNYDRIFTTGIGAIQELARKVGQLESQQAKLAELERENAALRASLDRQETRLAAIESLLGKGSGQLVLPTALGTPTK